MKNWQAFILGVICTVFVWWFSSPPKDTWERELNNIENHPKGVVFIVYNPNLEGTKSNYTGYGKWGKSTVIIFRHSADAEDALLHAQGSDKKFIDVLREIKP